MKVIESIRYNRTGEVNDAVLFDEDVTDPSYAIVLVTQAVAARNEQTRRNLFTTTAIRVEF